MKKLKDKNYFHVFTAGRYPQGTVTAEDLKQIAESYDPSVYEAPVWIGHPGSVTPEEPKAYGWVESLHAEENKLYASFSHLDDDLIGMVKEKKYRRCSVEFGKLNYEPLKGRLYLVAIALTNRPAVAGLAPLEFTAPERNYKPEMVSGKTLYTLKEKTNSKQNKKNQMEKILTFAGKIGIELKDDYDEGDIADELRKKFTAINESAGEFRKTAVDMLIKFAIAESKIVPAQESEIRTFAEENLEACIAFVDKLPSKSLFKNKINTSGFLGSDNRKFIKPDGTKLTYSDVLKDPGKYSRLLTEEEIGSLREESDLLN